MRKKYIYLVAFFSFLFATNISFAQASTGYEPEYRFIKTQGIISDGSKMGSIRFMKLVPPFGYIERANIQAVSRNSIINDSLALDLTFSTGATDLQERMRMLSNGMIGINTDSPNARLDIHHYLGEEDTYHQIFNISGGLLASPRKFSISVEESNPNDLQAKLQGNLWIESGQLEIDAPNSNHTLIRAVGGNDPDSREFILKTNNNGNLHASLEGDLLITKGGSLSISDGDANILNGILKVNTEYIPPGYVSAFNGSIVASELLIEKYDRWPDYVFEPTYELTDLREVSAYISSHGHLPGIPDAKTIRQNGFLVADMQAIAIEKIEELYLYLIQINEKQRQLLKDSKQQIKELEYRLSILEKIIKP